MVNLFPHFTSLAMMERTNERASIDYVHQFDNGVSKDAVAMATVEVAEKDAFPVDDGYAALPAAPSKQERWPWWRRRQEPEECVAGTRAAARSTTTRMASSRREHRPEKYQKAKDNGTLQQQQPRPNQAGPLQAKKGRKRK